jgi:undecaprenyl-diphosphatase
MNLDLFMVLVSDWGPAIPLLCLLLTADKKIITRGIASILLTWGVTQPLKLIVARPRPFIVGDAQLVGKAPEGFSFPSQHAAFSFTMATTTVLYRRTLGIIALLSAALVAYSRVYLGVHYWGDIIAGAIIGSLVAYAVDKAFSHYEKKHPKKR